MKPPKKPRKSQEDKYPHVIGEVRSLRDAPLLEVVSEYRFHPERKWRADFAILNKRILIEVEGGIWTGGRHTRGAGFAADMDKYNIATLLGWRLLRFTPSQIKDKTYLALVDALIG
jgi:very-short-patch-repair endonuclease